MFPGGGICTNAQYFYTVNHRYGGGIFFVYWQDLTALPGVNFGQN